MKNIHNLMQNEYEMKNQIYINNLIDRQNEVYQKIPEIVEIQDQINQAGIKYNKMILRNADSANEVISILLNEINHLNEKRESLLIQHGFSTNYLDRVYECNKCLDSGFIVKEDGSISTEKCGCYKQKLLNKLYTQSNLQILKTANFSLFDAKFYSPEVNEAKFGIKISPRQNILKIKQRCLNFIENFKSAEEKSLFFNGSTGVGKTFMSNCIAIDLLNKGVTVLYQTAPMLFDIINQHKVKSFRHDDFRDYAYEKILNVELLIIDDLGTEPTSAARYAELLTILNTRQTNNLTKPCKTIISTNMGAQELYENYTERVASRIIGSFDMYKFVGDDIRMIKKFKDK